MIDIKESARQLSERKGSPQTAWVGALNLVKADAGRARISIEKLDTIIDACKDPADLETSFKVILALHKEDGKMQDAWAFFCSKISDADFQLPAWCRAIEAVHEYLSKHALKATMKDILEYILCTTEGPDIKTGKAPLATAVSHYLEEYGMAHTEPSK